MSATRDKRFQRAQMRVLFQVPFFAPAVAKLSEVVWDPAVETACTNGERLKWNPEFFDKLKDQEIVSVLCHEAMHCMLGHLWRAPSTVQGGEGWDKWNYATDHAVNLALQEFSQLVMSKNLADPFPFPDEYPPLRDPQYKGLSEEIIFSRIKSPPGGGGKAGKGKPGKGGIGQIERPAGAQADPAQQKKLANDWDGTLLQACQLAKGRGDLPVGMERFVNELVQPKVPWQEILRSWLREQCSDDWDWLKPAMEYEQSGFILPSLNSDRVGSVIMARDSSGSISDHVHAQFRGEQQNCLDDMRPKKLVDVHFDTKVHHVAEYGPGDVISHKRHCGGGTDFRPVFDWIAKQAESPKCVVILTDLDGTFPKEVPPYPVLWVSTCEGQVPFGEVVCAGS